MAYPLSSSDPADDAPRFRAGASVVPPVPFSDDPRDREHDANGHYAIGPKLARPALARLIAQPAFTPSAPTPTVARGMMRDKQRRARRALRGYAALAAAIRGKAA